MLCVYIYIYIYVIYVYVYLSLYIYIYIVISHMLHSRCVNHPTPASFSLRA